MSRLPLSRCRNPVQTVLYQLDSCIEAFAALEEIEKLHKVLLDPNCDRAKLPFPREVIVSLLKVTRDSCCIYLRRLLEKDKKRRDCLCVHLKRLFCKRKGLTKSHSLGRYYSGTEIDALRSSSIVRSCIKAANKNIAHSDVEYTKWPDVRTLTQSDVKEKLEQIRLGILVP